MNNYQNQDKLEIIILAENKVYKKGLIAEHGLSFYIKTGDKGYLFDTGQGFSIIHNANEIGIDLREIKAVFLSHGHYDHTGGLKKLLEINKEVTVYAHPGVFDAKYSGTEYRGGGISREDIPSFEPVRGVTRTAGNFWLVGDIPGYNNYEKSSRRYKVKKDNEFTRDNFEDEQVLVIETPQGLIVLSGCAHRGIVNTLEYVSEKFKGNKIYAILGGMHLINAENSRIKKTVDYLDGIDFKLLVPLHCTGVEAVNYMVKRFKERVSRGEVGSRFVFPY
ncbi:MBL fold metallo-hydrolase [Halothermothrix orenii]|nr:MBL fold metallo-hydrolase [Halothermothrix orenii]